MKGQWIGRTTGDQVGQIIVNVDDLAPLLDWTYSPYVAAFFAFRNIPKKSVDSGFVRILILNQKKWKTDLKQLMMLNTAGLHLSILEFLAIDNKRFIPQQGATTVTNIKEAMDKGRTKFDVLGFDYEMGIDFVELSRQGVDVQFKVIPREVIVNI